MNQEEKNTDVLAEVVKLEKLFIATARFRAFIGGGYRKARNNRGKRRN